MYLFPIYRWEFSKWVYSEDQKQYKSTKQVRCFTFCYRRVSMIRLLCTHASFLIVLSLLLVEEESQPETQQERVTNMRCAWMLGNSQEQKKKKRVNTKFVGPGQQAKQKGSFQAARSVDQMASILHGRQTDTKNRRIEKKRKRTRQQGREWCSPWETGTSLVSRKERLCGLSLGFVVLSSQRFHCFSCVCASS